MEELYCDYLVIGAGAAGCVVANRLSKQKQFQVFCLEAGGNDTNPYIKIPAGFSKTVYNPKLNWPYFTSPSKNTGNRSIKFPRGKVVGGSSSINGHLYVRGQAADYDGWAQLGCTGWDWDGVLPYFKKAETRINGDKKIRGTSGPLIISDLNELHPLTKIFIDTVDKIGIKKNSDYNSGNQEGTATYQNMIKNNVRWSAADAYLRPILHQKNFKLIKNSLVEKLILTNKKITGVIFKNNNSLRKINVRKEVILSAGSINSPQILQLSGIGDKFYLEKLGIKCLIHSPEVGKNLKDHYAIRIAMRVKNISTYNEKSRGFHLLKEVFKYVFFKKGMLTTPVSTGAVFAKTRKELSNPNVQLLFAPASYDSVNVGTAELEKLSGMTCGITQLRPTSKGWVKITSAKSNTAPEIQPNYLNNSYDQQTIVEGIKLVRKIFSSPPLSQYCVEETLPGKSFDNYDKILTYAQNNGSTIYHPIGTCRMGNDKSSVVDLNLKFNGVDNLRVIDASIMPEMVSGNTYAATNMIAEKGSEIILKKN